MYLSTAVLTRLSMQSVWVALERAKIGLIFFFFLKFPLLKKICLMVSGHTGRAIL